MGINEIINMIKRQTLINEFFKKIEEFEINIKEKKEDYQLNEKEKEMFLKWIEKVIKEKSIKEEFKKIIIGESMLKKYIFLQKYEEVLKDLYNKSPEQLLKIDIQFKQEELLDFSKIEKSEIFNKEYIKN